MQCEVGRIQCSMAVNDLLGILPNYALYSSYKLCRNLPKKSPFSLHIILHEVINPRRACAARVTVVGFVCLSVTLNLTSRVFVRLTKETTYLTGNEGQKFRTVFSENAPL